MVAPLESLRVLDFSTLLPGPFAGMILADLGADVIRVESPRQPDWVRYQPPLAGETSMAHAVLNRSKRSLALDLKCPAAVEVVLRLVRTYDIVLEGFRPGVMDRLGAGYAALSAANPAVIYCALTGYGQTGPYRDRAGHDLNYVALSGIAGLSGRSASGPPPLGVQLADVGGGALLAVAGILSAVIQRAATGTGQLVDVAMLDGLVAWNTLAAGQYLATGVDRQPEDHWLNGGSLYDYYRTRDGRYLAIAGIEPKFWAGFCTAIARPDLIERGLDLDPTAVRALKAELATIVAGRTLAEWGDLCATLDVCVEPVLSISEVLAHPQVQARGLLIDVPCGDGAVQRQIGSALKFSAAECRYRHPGAALGAHTDEILRAAGYGAEEIAALRASGAVA